MSETIDDILSQSPDSFISDVQPLDTSNNTFREDKLKTLQIENIQKTPTKASSYKIISPSKPEIIKTECNASLTSPVRPVNVTPETKAASPLIVNVQESLATAFLKNNKLVHVPSMAAILVEGTKGDKYVVTLFPKPKCSCPATSNCFHIIACQRSVGIEIKNDKPKILNLPPLRKNSRKRSDKKSGRKKPRINDYEIIPAPDSLITTSTPCNEPPSSSPAKISVKSIIRSVEKPKSSSKKNEIWEHWNIPTV